METQKRSIYNSINVVKRKILNEFPLLNFHDLISLSCVYISAMFTTHKCVYLSFFFKIKKKKFPPRFPFFFYYCFETEMHATSNNCHVRPFTENPRLTHFFFTMTATRHVLRPIWKKTERQNNRRQFINIPKSLIVVARKIFIKFIRFKNSSSCKVKYVYVVT